MTKTNIAAMLLGIGVLSTVIIGCDRDMSEGTVINNKESIDRYLSKYYALVPTTTGLSKKWLNWVDSTNKYEVGDTVWIMKKQ